jgi:hypothetical protein
VSEDVAGAACYALLGDEYDQALIRRTWDLLVAMGGRRGPGVNFVAGSQDVSIQEWTLDGRTLRFEIETYMGFSVEGPEAQVKALVARLAADGFQPGEVQASPDGSD